MAVNNIISKVRTLSNDIGTLTNVLPAGKTLEQAIADGDIGGGSNGYTPIQITRMGIVASSGTPYTERFTILETLDFNRPTVEILKFVAGEQNRVITQCAFDVADSSKFNADAEVVFDGVMKLKTSYTSTITDYTTVGVGKVFSYTISKANTQSLTMT